MLVPSFDCENTPIRRGTKSAGALSALPRRAMEKRKQQNVIDGPDGHPLTVWDLPLVADRRWTPLRKARIVVAVRGGLISADEVRQRYNLTLEELEIWQREFGSNGIKGLRVTCIQRHRS